MTMTITAHGAVDVMPQVAFAPVPVRLSDVAHPLHPARHLPAVAPRVRYDQHAFRRTVGISGLNTVPLATGFEFESAWDLGERDYRWEGALTQTTTSLKADLALDATAITFGCEPKAAARWRNVDESFASDKPLAEQVLARRMRHIYVCHDAAAALAQAHLTTGGFPNLAGHFGPDGSVPCVYERAATFAARAIAAGVDDVLARSWSSAIIVAAGLSRPRWYLSHMARDVVVGSPLVPRATDLSRFYSVALRDLRERGDGTRFMTLAARVYAASGQGSPGNG
ncbi:hypothetical protein ACNI3K_00495 [Demequina sp. SO4-13]|uniref:hypothetical protein n=1 Tax=Demequina sp. SO4-13 TaxID=3401027 RepID=UPI003AF87FD8